MQQLTLTLDEGVLARAQMEAAKKGQSLSELVSSVLTEALGPPLTQQEALARFLAGPPLHLLDENGKAPSRDEMHE